MRVASVEPYLPDFSMMHGATWTLRALWFAYPIIERNRAVGRKRQQVTIIRPNRHSRQVWDNQLCTLILSRRRAIGLSRKRTIVSGKPMYGNRSGSMNLLIERRRLALFTCSQCQGD